MGGRLHKGEAKYLHSHRKRGNTDNECNAWWLSSDPREGSGSGSQPNPGQAPFLPPPFPPYPHPLLPPAASPDLCQVNLLPQEEGTHVYLETGGWRWEASRGDRKETVPPSQTGHLPRNELVGIADASQEEEWHHHRSATGELKTRPGRAPEDACCWEQFSVAFRRVAMMWPGGPLSPAMLKPSQEPALSRRRRSGKPLGRLHYLRILPPHPQTAPNSGLVGQRLTL